MGRRVTSNPDSQPRDFLSGGGEMGAVMRTMDWSKTKLGPVETWPQSLKTSVSTCLNSRFAILVWWGPDLVMLYNDAYREIIAGKHPAALGNPGRECWLEIWDTIGPMLEGVLQRGEATWSDDLLLPLERNGYAEECYFTFSYSPISDETGGVGGVFTPVMETTERVIGERRSNTLRELAVSSVQTNSEERVWALAAEILGRNRSDISFSVFYVPAADGKGLLARGWNGIRSQHLLCRGAEELGERRLLLMRAVSDCLSTGEAIVVRELEQRCPQLPPGIWGIAPTEAVALPITLPGGLSPAASLLVGLNARKQWNEDYREFLEMVARQVASNLAAARAQDEEKKRVAELAKLNRAKTVFFSNVSHEFRTPLTLIVGPLETILERSRGTADANREELQRVHRNSMRLLKMVNTLLDFSRIEAGRVQAVYQATDLATFTADTASAFRSTMEQAGLEYVIDCPPMPEPAYVDRDMWEKIVLNLLSNAFKFTLSGKVAVLLRAVENKFELRVEDTGLGIPEDQQSRVFERFHRVEGVRGRTHEGSGIGLALVQELAKLHGGSIRMESVFGKGSTFVVSIPRGYAHLPAEHLETERILSSTGVSASAYVDEALRWLPETEQPNERPQVFAADSVQAPHVQTASGKILLADDNADMRGYVRKLLGDHYEVHAASNGLEALAMVRLVQPDLVLTDVMMPGLDGFGLLEKLRADESTSTIPVILLSARAGEDARVEGMEAGADDYIVKPFTARELLARVGAHLALSRMRREAEKQERALRAELETRVEQRTSDLQAANQELRQLSSRLQRMQDEERRHLARELHDSVGQLLVALAINISMVKKEAHKLSPEVASRVEDNAAMIEQISTEIRTISHLLHPPLLDEIGLASALRWYVHGFAQRSGIETTLDLPEVLDRLSPAVEIAIFRAVQEGLTNVHRHSGSPNCRVKVIREENELRVEIRDAGQGIAKHKQPELLSLHGGVGLRGMQERLRELGGTLEIHSSAQGTTVLVTLPLPPAGEIATKSVA